MQWSDEAIVLATRKHGESSVIVSLLTREHGRHAGLVRGGQGRRHRGVLQPGNRVAATWRARLAEHLGSMTCELTHALAAPLFGDRMRLAALGAACAVAEDALPEREPHAAVYERLVLLLQTLAAEGWQSAYVRWELALLADLGFGLDLSRCAATGTNDHLAYVSPRSGRAVSLAAAEPYRDRLMPLPAFLLDDHGTADRDDTAAGLDLTGYFLERHVFAERDRPLPPARRRLRDALDRCPMD